MRTVGLLLLLAALASGADTRVRLTISPPVVVVGRHLEQTIRCEVVNASTDRVLAIQIYDVDKENVIAFVGALRGRSGEELRPAAVVEPELRERMTASGSVANASEAFLELQHGQIRACCNVQHLGCMVFFGDGTDFVAVNATAIYKPQNANNSRIMAFKHCPPPPAVPHGNATDRFQGNFPAGSSVTYVCQHGFLLAGSKAATCRAGVWHDVPTCVAKPKPTVKVAALSPRRVSSPAATALPSLALLAPLLPALIWLTPVTSARP